MLTQQQAPEAETNVKLAKLQPSRRQNAQNLVDCIHADVLGAITTIQQSLARAHDGVKAKSRERVLSLADRRAPLLKKAGGKR